MSGGKKHNIFLSIVIGVNFVSYVLLLVFALNKNVVCTLTFSAIIIVCFVLSIVSPLVSREKVGKLDLVTIVSSLVVTTLLIFAVVYSIPDEKLSNIILTLISSMIGGGMTLFGVGLTIKHAAVTKEENEINSCRPLVFPFSVERWKAIPADKKISAKIEINKGFTDLQQTNKKENYYTFDSIYLANSDLSICDIYGLFVNDFLIKFEFEEVLSKDSNNEIKVNFKFELDETIQDVYLILEDIHHNFYVAETGFTIKSCAKSVKKIVILSVKTIEFVGQDL